MTRLRLLANVAVAVVLAALLVGLVCISIVERCGRNVKTEPTFEQVDFEPGHYKTMKDRRTK